jgi:glutathione S-transferase
MEPVYHLVLPSNWSIGSDRDYAAASLAGEGFIHCSFADQVEASANRFYADAAEILVLRIDPARLRSPMKVEASGSGALFPHIYGPINRDAVTQVIALERVEGRWVFPVRQ